MIFLLAKPLISYLYVVTLVLFFYLTLNTGVISLSLLDHTLSYTLTTFHAVITYLLDRSLNLSFFNFFFPQKKGGAAV